MSLTSNSPTSLPPPEANWAPAWGPQWKAAQRLEFGRGVGLGLSLLDTGIVWQDLRTRSSSVGLVSSLPDWFYPRFAAPIGSEAVTRPGAVLPHLSFPPLGSVGFNGFTVAIVPTRVARPLAPAGPAPIGTAQTAGPDPLSLAGLFSFRILDPRVGSRKGRGLGARSTPDGEARGKGRYSQQARKGERLRGPGV